MNDKNKKLLNEVLSLIDENEELKRKLENNNIAIAATQGIGELAVADQMAGLTAVCIDYGKQELFSHLFSTWRISDHEASKIVNDKFEEIPFDEWLDTLSYDVFTSSSDGYLRKLVSAYSFNELVQFFRDQFREYYQKDVDNRRMKWVASFKKDNN